MKTLKMISLFTGAGGFDYGFEAAGFEVLAAVEWDHDCCDTIRANRQWPVIEKDINEVPSNEILDLAGLRQGEADLLIGGPPCQPFSKSAYWINGDTMRLDDPRANTLSAFMRCVSDILPKAFVLENVHGIKYSGKEEGFRLLTKLTMDINRRMGTDYRLSWKILNMADYGVPQTRKRFFLTANRDGKAFKFPHPTHVPQTECNEAELEFNPIEVSPYITAWDAVGGMEVELSEDLGVKGRWADLLPSIPEGENYLWHTNRRGGLPLFGWRTRYWSFLLKLAKNRPSWTIQAQPGPAIGPFHWENRYLSTEEMARLQTFPMDVTFMGKKVSIQRQIGNAVPSLMGEILAREIAEQFFGLERSDKLAFALGVNRPIPPPEPIQPVPKKYLSLVGDYPDHPGEGKGKRAILKE